MVNPSELSREELERLLREAEQQVMPGYEPKPAPEQPANVIRVQIDMQRLREVAPSKYWAGAENNRVTDTLHLLSYCVVNTSNGGGYVPHKEAFDQLGELSLMQIETLLEAFKDKVKEIAVPFPTESA